ncbi:MAG: hypothetical protein ACREHG_09670, partial [Candidatus Saccharimonadales bacterium]
MSSTNFKIVEINDRIDLPVVGGRYVEGTVTAIKKMPNRIFMTWFTCEGGQTVELQTRSIHLEPPTMSTNISTIKIGHKVFFHNMDGSVRYGTVTAME